MNVKAVAYYTPDYLDEATKLFNSAKYYCVDIWIREIMERSWQEAVMYKPTFILEQLLNAKPEVHGLLYTDADSMFCQNPDFSIFEFNQHNGVDFAAHWFKRSPHHATELLTGTMYFANNDKVRHFVRDWILETPKFAHSYTPEQDALKAVFERWKGKLEFLDFGPEWVWIFDDFPPIYGQRNIVVEHFQASRRLKDKPPKLIR